mgnify:CR=1 FL=1
MSSSSLVTNESILLKWYELGWHNPVGEGHCKGCEEYFWGIDEDGLVFSGGEFNKGIIHRNVAMTAKKAREKFDKWRKENNISDFRARFRKRNCLCKKTIC